MFVIQADVGAQYKLFELIGNDYYLNFVDGMSGRVALQTGITDLGALKGQAKRVGNAYQVKLTDYHGNVATMSSFQVATPASGTKDARGVGVRGDGSYWGGGGEQIDMRTGNLNFTIPLLNAQSRNGGVTFALNYNSQNWRYDASGTWKLVPITMADTSRSRSTGFGSISFRMRLTRRAAPCECPMRSTPRPPLSFAT